jgi:hypothetical protein
MYGRTRGSSQKVVSSGLRDATCRIATVYWYKKQMPQGLFGLANDRFGRTLDYHVFLFHLWSWPVSGGVDNHSGRLERLTRRVRR